MQIALSRNVVAVYFAGLLQGLALVSFPATGPIFTNPEGFNLSSTDYGALFIPQAVLSIAASLLSTRLARLRGIRFVFLSGLTANLLSMLLLAISPFLIGHQGAYGMLLFATASLGIGFGLTVPSLNTLAARFFPKKTDSAVLALNALLGLGTALAPLLIVIFTDFGLWWGLPSLLSLLLLSLLLFSLPLTLKVQQPGTPKKNPPLPRLFWLFALFAFLYGILETVNGNWATIYMKKNLDATTTLSSLALCLFWTMVTAGRILFSVTARFFSSRSTFCLLPFVIATAFLAIYFLPSDNALAGVLAFGLAGLGCSALLPLIISFGDQAFSNFKASSTGNLIALYLAGYGVAAFGIGPLQEWAGWDLSTIFGTGTLLAIALGLLAFMIRSKLTSK